MKQRIIAFIIFIFIGSMLFVTNFIQVKNDNYFKLTEIGQTVNSKKVVISTDINDAKESCRIITFFLKQFKGNIYCFDVKNKGDKKIYIKYIFAETLDVFDSLEVSEGRFFNAKEMESELYLSTEKSVDANQIGVIDSFSKDINFQIKTLKTYIENNTNPFQKMFVIQMQDNDDFALLSAELEKNDIILAESGYETQSLNINEYIGWISLVGVLIMMLVVFYNLIRNYKTIGVEKLLGYSFVSIWAKRVVPLVLMEIITFLFVPIVLSLFLFEKYGSMYWEFILKVLIIYGVVVFVTVVLLSVPFVFVKKITISSIIKNQRPLKSLLRFNFCIKTIVTVILIFLLTICFLQYETVSVGSKDKYKYWEKTKAYAFIPILIFTDETFDSDSIENAKKSANIYFQCNRNGAILADFHLYTSDTIQDQEEEESSLHNNITVNPNYLNLFSIKDENGNIVNISEQDEDYIVLVPKKYKDNEKILKKQILLWKNSYASGPNLGKRKKQETRIIWVEDNQDYFSMKLDVGIDNNNCIKDPITIVLTEANGVLNDYNIVAGVNKGAFKIKVKDYKNPIPEVNKIFSKYYDLTVFEFPAISTYQSVEEQISLAKDKISVCLSLFSVLAVIIICIIIQHINTYTEHNKKVLAIKKFLGFRYVDKHIGYYLSIMVCYCLSGAVAFGFLKSSFIIISSIILMMIDCVISYVYIEMLERKNILAVSKGG